MPTYISEFNYYGIDAEEFVEVAVPAGTDTSSYSITVYGYNGNAIYTWGLGTAVATIAGHDVYLIDAASPGFSSGGDPTGLFYPDDAIALFDGSSVVQFISYGGNTVSPASGPAAGMTSTSVGTVTAFGNSLQSDNGGTSYFEQTVDNPGTIPACYGPGTRIDTPKGPRPVEELRAGDFISDASGTPREILWTWQGNQALDNSDAKDCPILIRAGALGAGQPSRDLVVSAQHRMMLPNGALAPAKGLTGLPRIRPMRGKRAVTWYHFACHGHHVVRANGAYSESLLLGPVIVGSLTRRERLVLVGLFGPFKRADGAALNGPPVRTCLTVRQARAFVARGRLLAPPTALRA